MQEKLEYLQGVARGIREPGLIVGSMEPKLLFKSGEQEAKWGKLAQQVLREFNLPRKRLICTFDDTDYSWMKDQWGTSRFRGASTPVMGSGPWPDFVQDVLVDREGIAYDFITYLPGRTCLSGKALLVITFAHELQHFLQWAISPKVWKVGSILYGNLRTFEPTRQWKTWDVPTEREAMIVSKRVAEKVLGVQQVKGFSETRVLADRRDKEEWQVFGSLSSSEEYRLLDETIPLVETYRQRLMELETDEEDVQVDFSRGDWWS